MTQMKQEATQMHIGVEVEGRFKGMQSLFIYAEDLVTDERKALVDKALDKWQVVQVNVYAVGGYDAIKEIDFNYLEELSHTYLIVMEVSDVLSFGRLRSEGKLPNFPVSLVLTIDCDDLWLLSETDQIKFVKNKHVKTFTLETAVKTQPEDFLADIFLSNQLES